MDFVGKEETNLICFYKLVVDSVSLHFHTALVKNLGQLRFIGSWGVVHFSQTSPAKLFFCTCTYGR